MSNKIEEIDWSEFEKFSEMNCFCRCTPFPGFEFRSHTKAVMHEGKLIIATEKPCPSCGEYNNLRSSSSDWESFTI